VELPAGKVLSITSLFLLNFDLVTRGIRVSFCFILLLALESEYEDIFVNSS
jgi:hypothetical protein